MPLLPLADKDGYITVASDQVLVGAEAEAAGPDAWEIQSTGDPALDRILVRCHIVEGQTRRVSAQIDTLTKNLWVVPLCWLGVFLLGWVLGTIVWPISLSFIGKHFF